MKWAEWPSPLPSPQDPSPLSGQASLKSYSTRLGAPGQQQAQCPPVTGHYDSRSG